MLESQEEPCFEKEFFDSGEKAPGQYDAYSFDQYCESFKPLAQVIKKHFNPQRVLDIGCAKGSFVCTFRALDIEAYGVDVSAYAVACAPKNLQPCLSVVDLDKQPLPFPDGYFDCITFFGAIEYLHDHKHAISEIERVISDGGSLLLTTIFKRPKGDQYRVNAHNKAFWLKEFGDQWTAKKNSRFMSEYLQKSTGTKSVLGPLKRLAFGKTRFGDRVLLGLLDALASLGVLNYGVLLLTYRKA